MSLRLKHRSHEEDGFSTTWVLGFAVLLLIIGLVFFEVGRVFVEREKLIAAADAAANAGATAINEDVLISSSGEDVVLDPEQAEQRCLDSLFKSKSNGGQAETILDANQKDNFSSCEVSSDNSLASATARGTIKFGVIFSFLGISEKELIVRSSAKPSCSDNADIEGGC